MPTFRVAKAGAWNIEKMTNRRKKTESLGNNILLIPVSIISNTTNDIERAMQIAEARGSVPENL